MNTIKWKQICRYREQTGGSQKKGTWGNEEIKHPVKMNGITGMK